MTPERTRELLENCAKACDYNIKTRDYDHCVEFLRQVQPDVWVSWNPLTNLADYSEMEAYLLLNVWWHEDCVEVGEGDSAKVEDYCGHLTPQLARMFAGCRAAEALYFQSLLPD